jgi:hypothetical protein
VTLHWTGGDLLSGLSHYELAVKVDDGEWQVLDSNLSRGTASYVFNKNSEDQLVFFRLIAYDMVGNMDIAYVGLYTEDYEFPNGYIFPYFVGLGGD